MKHSHLQAAMLAATVVVAGCLYPMPHTRDPETGHYECPIGHPIRATIGVGLTGLLAASAFYEARHYTAPPPDMYGAPTGIDVGAGFYRVVGWTIVGVAVLETLGAVDSWSKHAKCSHLEDDERAAVAQPTGSGSASPPLQKDPELDNLVKPRKVVRPPATARPSRPSRVV